MKILRLFLLLVSANSGFIYSQFSNDLQYWRTPGFEGLNVFETTKISDEFKGFKVHLGGDFALQFQSLDHSTSSADTLAVLGSNFNLPTANLNIDVQLYSGIRMSLITYLSSRHHNEAWVKGGHIQIDNLDFIKKDFLKGLMDVMTIRTGLDEINYGDVHFRRSDNARVIYNPFVGNYLMDAFSTEAYGELTFQKRGYLLVTGISNGKLNQSVIKGNKNLKPSLYGKIGYDNLLGEHTRFRLTGSFYASPAYDNGYYLYSGDRTGSRYYSVMQEQNASDDFRSGRFSPGFHKFTSYQVNPFVKWKRVEFFGVCEYVSGNIDTVNTGGYYTQIGAELIVRFGTLRQFYLGGRYNMISGKDTKDSDSKNIERINLGGGWYMTHNILLKAEFVNQNYYGRGWVGSIFEGGNFQGVVFEAAIGF